MQRAGGSRLSANTDPATENDIELNYSGSLAGLLNHVALRSDLRWSFESGRIRFYRVVSRTIAVKTLPGGLKLSSSLSLSSTGGGTASSSSASDINIWTGIEKNLANMATLMYEINTIAKFRTIYDNDPNLMLNGRPVFDSEEDIIMQFLCSGSGQGPYQLRTCLPYHSPYAEDFMVQILTALDLGGTVIVDLSNAPDKVVRYFAQKLCLAIFAEQEHKFKMNALSGRYVQIYFEEAHTIFPLQDTAMTHVYARFAKEGAKFHIGIAYATQSPTTINPDLLAQTENFFIGHLSSQKEVDALCNLQVAFQGCENAIRFNRTPGLMQVLTQSHRYVVPMQAQLFDGRKLMVT